MMDIARRNFSSSTPFGTLVVHRREYVSSVNAKIMYHLDLPNRLNLSTKEIP